MHPASATFLKLLDTNTYSVNAEEDFLPDNQIAKHEFVSRLDTPVNACGSGFVLKFTVTNTDNNAEEMIYVTEQSILDAVRINDNTLIVRDIDDEDTIIRFFGEEHVLKRSPTMSFKEEMAHQEKIERAKALLKASLDLIGEPMQTNPRRRMGP